MTEQDDIPSFNAQLRALQKGDSLAKAERFQVGSPHADAVNERLQAMRRTVNSAVSRVRKAVGSNFRVESGALLTDDNAAVIATVVVTRQ